jgi:hypothetical protein
VRLGRSRRGAGVVERMYVNRAEGTNVVAIPARGSIVVADNIQVAADLRLLGMQRVVRRAGAAAGPRRG